MGETSVKMAEVKVSYCVQCGKCSGSCPAAKFLEMRPRKVVLMYHLGMVDELIESGWIWMCADCLACEERCPYEVGPHSLIMELRAYCARGGLKLPAYYRQVVSNITKTGFVQEPVSIRTRARRRVDRSSLGLPEPKGPSRLEDFAEKVRKLLEVSMS